MLRQGSSGPSLPSATVALLGAELALAEGADETIRRLSLLVEVADTVTQRLSLDHQLPRLIELIAEALELALHDRPSRIFFDRCRYYTANPPAEEWDGVWIMEQK
jgi:hypothetical protein